jgi:hypothetical protein
MDAVFAHEDLGPLVIPWLDVQTLLALRRTCRAGKQAADREFSLVRARRFVRLRTRLPHRRREEGEYLMTVLARRGELRLIQWARCGERVAWDERATAEAASNGHIHVIQWMCFEADPPMPYAKRSEAPAEYPRAGFVGVECKAAARAGRLDVLDWLRERDFALSSEACHEAVKKGHLHIVKRICCACDPAALWLGLLLKKLEDKAFMCDFDLDKDDHTEEEHARYKHRIRQWLPILEWYVPFATKSERRKIYDVVPEQWFLP